MPAWLLFIIGVFLLLAGGELLVRGASRLALTMGIKPLVLGITVIAIGTSSPELVVGITAGLQGRGTLAVGNIAGANLLNILFTLGLTALIRPLPLHSRLVRFELPVMIVSTIMMAFMAWDGILSHHEGALLVTSAVLFTVVLIRKSREETKDVKKEYVESSGVEAVKKSRMIGTARLKYSGILATGIALAVIGAGRMVSGAADIARSLGVSEAIIGLTIVAFGTTAPELVISIIATIRNVRDVAVGNLLGSSIYNILLILGITCLVSPGGVLAGRELVLIDIPLMIGMGLICVPIFITGKRISRLEGGLCVAIYLLYMLYLLIFRL